MAKRINLRCDDDVYIMLVEWAKKLGITQSQLGGMALKAGLLRVIQSMDPIGGLSEEQLSKIISAAANAGVEIKDVPEKKE